MTLKVTDEKKFTAGELAELMASVGWGEDATPDVFLQAMMNATHVISARADGKLVGIVRSMDDGCWSANIDCLVVHKDYAHKGIGTMIMRVLLDKLASVKYISVSPNEAKNASFYVRFGFKLVPDGRLLQICK